LAVWTRGKALFVEGIPMSSTLTTCSLFADPAATHSPSVVLAPLIAEMSQSDEFDEDEFDDFDEDDFDDDFDDDFEEELDDDLDDDFEQEFDKALDDEEVLDDDGI
jgi:hypothetical protein